jgi:hypothetical protein
MSIILPEVPSFSQKLARNLGGGFSEGLGKSQDLFSRLIENHEQEKNKAQYSQPKEMSDAQKDKIRAARGAKAAIDSMRANMEYTGSTFGKAFGFFSRAPGLSINRKAVEKRAEFDQDAFMLEGFLREKATKGTLPGAIFQKLLERLPNSELYDRENEGRLKGIERQIAIYLPDEYEEIFGKKEEKINKESKKNRPTLESFYDQ